MNLRELEQQLDKAENCDTCRSISNAFMAEITRLRKEIAVKDMQIDTLAARLGEVLHDDEAMSYG